MDYVYVYMYIYMYISVCIYYTHIYIVWMIFKTFQVVEYLIKYLH